ncbi:Probable LRR receptor-like serine/threonine-protein kinase At5g63710 [Linum perenne]
MIMEGDSHSPSAAASASVVVIAFDATKERSVKELKATIDGVRGKGDILSPGDRLVFLGVLDKVPHPTSIRVMEEEVIKKVDIYVNKLSKSAGVCVDERVCVEVTMAAGTPPKQVVLQEVATFNAAWLILDRHLKRDLKFYLAQIPCKVALIHDDLSVEVERDHTRNVSDVTEQKTFYATSRHVPILDYQGYRNSRQSVIPCINYPLSGDSVNDSKWGMDRNNSPAISISTNQGGSDKTESTLQWHQRQAIAIGIGKGLRFLHEECRGSPIIHRDLRPSNVLLTHDFVPMAVPLIEELALHKLIDPRLGESYDTYELYQMAKAAYLCVQRNPEKRPSAGQVLSLLEGKDDHMQHFRDHFDPSYSSL